MRVLYIDEWPTIDPLSISGNGLGSSLFKLAAMADSFEADCEVNLLTSNSKKVLLEGSFGIHAIFTDPKKISKEEFDKIIFLGILKEQLSDVTFTDFHAFSNEDKINYKNTPHIDFWRKYNSSILNIKPGLPAKIKLHISREASIRAERLLGKRSPVVAISVDSISPLKNYDSWPSLIELILKQDFKVVLLGNKNQNFKEDKNLINLTGKTDLNYLKALIKTVDYFIGVDGLNSNLAMALNIPSVIMFTVISPDCVIPKGQQNVIPIFQAECPLQFCYPSITNYRNSGCLYNIQNQQNHAPIKCLQFTPLDIVTHLLKLSKI